MKVVQSEKFPILRNFEIVGAIPEANIRMRPGF
jgi:hypothetical protein